MLTNNRMEDLDEKIRLLKGKPVTNDADSHRGLDSTIHKIELLNLADDLGSISKACRVLGYSRQSYYRYKDAFAKEGYAGLLDKKRKATKRKRSIDAMIEHTVIAYAYRFPEHSKTKASKELGKVGVYIRPDDMNTVWVRHDLSNVTARNNTEQVLCKDKHIRQKIAQVMSELEKIEKQEKVIKEGYPGYLGTQECYFFGAIQGIGLVYQEVFVDVFSEVVFVKLYIGKKTPHAIDLLSDKVIPFYSAHSVNLRRILTTRSAMYCGQDDAHPYLHYLASQNIEHSKSSSLKNRYAESSCEYFHQTLQVEFNQIKLNKPVVGSLSLLQLELDEWLDFYNHKRSHPGERCNGRTPMETFITGKNELIPTIGSGKGA
jgi:hypothetical protein